MMHTCPFCGEECDCDFDDTGGLPVPDDCPHVCEDDDDYEDEDFGFEDDEFCDCGRRATDYCGFCGKPLCHMHFELGAGFCSGPHTQAQILEYERQVYGGRENDH